MTEKDWLTVVNARCLLPPFDSSSYQFPNLRLFTERKLRLIACQISRLTWSCLKEPVAVAEFGAAMARAEEYAETGVLKRPSQADRNWFALADSALDAARSVLGISEFSIAEADLRTRRLAPDIIRDIIGNPYRCQWCVSSPCDACAGNCGQYTFYGPDDNYDWETCPSCDGKGAKKDERPPWLVPSVQLLAEVAYQQRSPHGWLDPVTLAVVADAAEERGCPLTEKYYRHNLVVIDKVPEKGWQVTLEDNSDTVLYTHKKLWEAERWAAAEFRISLDVFRRRRAQSSAEVFVETERPNTLLEHLREPYALHARGCWALDYLRQKE